MILSNSAPKSYYEEYLRKRDTNRLLNTPATLLTDRNSYVNFLEIQLERVTAACMNLQSYDERFEDMQKLIVALEQRCSTSTKLISLAQQCTEEVRAETLQKIDTNYKEFKTFKSENVKVQDSFQKQLTHAQKSLDNIVSYELKLKSIENRLESIEQEQRTMQYQIKEDTLAIHNKFSNVESSQTELSNVIESIRGTISRLTFDLEENVIKTNNYVRLIEDRMNSNIESTKEILKDDIFSLDAKVTNQYNDCKSMIQTNNLEITSTIKKHYSSMNNEIGEFRKKWDEDIEGLSNRMNLTINNKIDSVHEYINHSIDGIKVQQDEQSNVLLDLENDIYSNLQTMQSNLCDLSQEQFDNSSKFEYVTKSIEERINTLDESNHEIANSIMSQSKSYNDLVLQSKANSISINQLMDMSMSLSSPISIKRPVNYYDQGNNNIDGNNIFPHYSSSIPTENIHIPVPMHRSYVVNNPSNAYATLSDENNYLNSIPRDSKVRWSFDDIPQSKISNENIAYDNNKTDNIERINNNNLEFQRNNNFESSIHDNKNNNQLMIVPKVINENSEDTSMDTVQVIEKFVDIYDTDQKKISQRLSEIISNNQQSSNIDETEKSEKNAGDVLGDFFQNYKKDRINIIKRLDKLSTSPRRTSTTTISDQNTFEKEDQLHMNDKELDDNTSDTLQESKNKAMKNNKKSSSNTQLLSKAMNHFITNYNKDHPITNKHKKHSKIPEGKDPEINESSDKAFNIQARDEFARYLYMKAHNQNRGNLSPTHQLRSYMGVGPGLGLEPWHKPVWKKPNTSSPTGIRRKQHSYHQDHSTSYNNDNKSNKIQADNQNKSIYNTTSSNNNNNHIDKNDDDTHSVVSSKSTTTNGSILSKLNTL